MIRKYWLNALQSLAYHYDNWQKIIYSILYSCIIFIHYLVAKLPNYIQLAYIPGSGPWRFVWSSSESQSCRCWDHLSPSVSASLHQQQWMCQFGPHQHLKEENKCLKRIYIVCMQFCATNCAHYSNHFTLSYTFFTRTCTATFTTSKPHMHIGIHVLSLQAA